MFINDKPIATDAEDRLARTDFVRNVARALVDLPTEDCFVVGLTGRWGCGKSSIINLLKASVHDEEQRKHDQEIEAHGFIRTPFSSMVVFDPWGLTDETLLCQQFFETLKQGIRGPTIGKPTSKQGSRGSSPDKEPLKQCIKILGDLAMITGAATPWPAAFAGLRQLAHTVTNNRLRPPYDLKKDLGRHLGELSRRIIVFIDNIDRLSDDAVALVFRLIASVADLPHVVYVLCFDDEVVAGALSRVRNENGREYLDKVLQVSIAVPEVPRARLRDLFYGYVGRQLTADESVSEQDARLWIGNSSVFPLVTLRNVKRLVNLFAFRYGPYESDLNALDMAALCSIELWKPRLYRWIAAHKALLVGDADPDMGAIMSDMKLLAGDSPSAVREYLDALLTLFPALPDVNDRPLAVNPSKTLSIRRAESFDNYFLGYIPPEPLSSAEQRAIDEAIWSGEAKRVIREYAIEGRLSPLVEELYANVGAHDGPTSRGVICGLLTYGVVMNSDDDEAGEMMARTLTALSLNIGRAERYEVFIDAVTRLDVAAFSSMIGYYDMLLAACGDGAGMNDDEAARLTAALLGRIHRCYESEAAFEGLSLKSAYESWMRLDEDDFRRFWQQKIDQDDYWACRWVVGWHEAHGPRGKERFSWDEDCAGPLAAFRFSADLERGVVEEKGAIDAAAARVLLKERLIREISHLSQPSLTGVSVLGVSVYDSEAAEKRPHDMRPRISGNSRFRDICEAFLSQD